ncbi:Bud-site selection protein [Infundibulicybe gibba]|nr:Bud-site selection protein [Infundibulicybe gibba]
MDGSMKRGIKRKRYEPPEKDLAVKVSGKLHHGLREVRKAAKKAKTFETQKLLKKLKGFRQKKGENPQEIADLEAQLVALKEITHEAAGNTALKTKINKDKLLSANEHVQAALKSELSSNQLEPALSATHAAKVQSRLLSSKILAAEIAIVVSDLKVVLQPRSDDGDAWVEEPTVQGPKKLKAKTGTAEGITEAAIVVGGSSDSGSDDEGEEAEAVDDAGWESGTINSIEDDDSDVGKLNTQPSGSESEISEDKQRKPRPAEKSLKPGTSKPLQNPPKAQSTFLPSLAVGFARAGSDDSEWSDSEAKLIDIGQKKNRRGQRARRAIWEKKYGRNANHKKKEAEVQKKILPVPPPPGKKYNKSVPQFRQQADTGWGQRTDQAAISSTSVRQNRTEPADRRGTQALHPSWEAKKRLKEREHAGIVPSQGKKIKFS